MQKQESRGIIDSLHDFGLCISYDRTIAISTDVANAVCTRFEMDGLVCPPQAVSGVFTTAAVDNIDHNPSSTTSQGSFHGTAISLLQHPTNENRGRERPAITIDENLTGRHSLSPLPVEYTMVNAVVLPKRDPLVPTIAGIEQTPSDAMQMERSVENSWLSEMKQTIAKSEFENNDVVSWTAYNSAKHEVYSDPVTPSFLLPLFPEVAHSVAMIYHAMNVVKAVVDYLNPGQVPILVADQPLFFLAKKIQWNFPTTHGEDKFVVFLGGMHIELAAFRLLGDWLDGSGWTTAIINSGVASGGTADSFIKVTHLAKTKHVHQLTAAALSILLEQAYKLYTVSAPPNDVLDIHVWCDKMSNEQPQFKYWTTVLELELTVLKLVGAMRAGDFSEYVQSLRQLVPWCFALDHINYARSLSLHLRDMNSLVQQHPTVYQHFCAGRFVAHKTNRPFSGMALDQAHEQLNALVKGDGRAVGLTEDPSALRRWMVAGPEISRIIQEFECNNVQPMTVHHEH